jgi:hypothetical protein
MAPLRMAWQLASEISGVAWHQLMKMAKNISGINGSISWRKIGWRQSQW